MKRKITKCIGMFVIAIMIFSTIFPTINLAYKEIQENQEEKIKKIEEKDIINNKTEDEEQNEEVENNENNIPKQDEEINEVDSKQESNDNSETPNEEKKENEEDNKNIEQKETQEQEPIMENTNIQTISSDNKAINTELTPGIYEIYSAKNSNIVIEVKDSSCSNFANIQLGIRTQLPKQRFEVSYDTKTNAYIIRALHSDKVLDVYAGKRVNFANIQQYSYNGSIAQQWNIKKTNDGYYNIISKNTNQYLDVYAGNVKNSTNIQLYAGNDSMAQKFGFRKIEDAKGTNVLKDGVYNIKSKVDSNKILGVEGKSKDNNKKIQLFNMTNHKSQSFVVKYLNNGYYSLKIQDSNKSLDVPGAEARNGINIQQYSTNNSVAQQWMLKDAGDGYFYIIARCNGLYVDIPAGQAKLGTNLQLYLGNNSNAQKFKFEQVQELKSDKLSSDGTYYITSAISNNKAVSVKKGEYGNFSNVQIEDKRNKEYQKFKMTYDEQLKAYTIIAMHSDKSLDVYASGQENGANVDQYQSNNSVAQQWILKEAGDGYYYIISKCNYLYLDLYAGSIANGTNIQMYEGNGSKAQKFKFVKATTETPNRTIANGTYHIVSKLSDNKVLQVTNQSVTNGAKIQVCDKLQVINKTQSFDIQYLGNGYYQIKAKKAGKALETVIGNSENGAQVQQNNYQGTTNQQWIIKEAGNGYYYIISRYNGLYFDIPGGSTNNNPVMQVYGGNGSEAQKFKFVEVKQELSRERTLPDGVYNIATSLDNNKVLDIAGGNNANGANVQIWDNAKVQQQKFQLTYNENDKYYEIKSVSSGKVLDVYNNGKSDGANVWQYQSNGSEAQKWILQEAGNGYYYIVALNSNLYLDIYSGKTSNGTNVQLYEGNQGYCQKFKFNRVTMVDNDSYKISIKRNDNKVLDINGGSNEENENLQIWTKEDVNQQVFRIEYIDKTYCKITVKHSNKALTVLGNNVVQATYDGKNSQQWSFEIVGNGYYKIKSKSTGLYLDVYANSTNDGANVRVYTGNTSEAQIFKLNEIPQRNGIDVSEFNGIINWTEVKKSGQVDFAIIRAGYRGYGSGKLVTDTQFVKNVTGASSNGIDIGIYFFTQAVTIWEAVEEANYVLNLIKSYNINVKYPIVIDTENSGSRTNGKLDNLGRADRLSVADRTAVCKAFCDTIRGARIYTSRICK